MGARRLLAKVKMLFEQKALTDALAKRNGSASV